MGRRSLSCPRGVVRGAVGSRGGEGRRPAAGSGAVFAGGDPIGLCGTAARKLCLPKGGRTARKNCATRACGLARWERGTAGVGLRGLRGRAGRRARSRSRRRRPGRGRPRRLPARTERCGPVSGCRRSVPGCLGSPVPSARRTPAVVGRKGRFASPGHPQAVADLWPRLQILSTKSTQTSLQAAPDGLD